MRNGGSLNAYTPVWNWGEIARNATFTSEFSVPVRLESSRSSSTCSQLSPTTVRCGLGDIDLNTYILVSVTPLEFGTITETTTVASDGTDANPADNTKTSTEEVSTANEADIAAQFGSGHPRTFGPFYAGVPFYYGVDVENYGPRDAANVTATVDLADGLIFDEGRTTDACSHAAGTVTCDLGTAEVDNDYILVWVTASEAGTYSSTLSLRSDTPDPRLWNNVASNTTTAEPMADLSATISESADPAKSGRALTFTMTVTNNGPSDVPDAKLTHYFQSLVSGFNPMKVEIKSIVPSQGTCSQYDAITVHCQLGALADGASATVQTTVIPRGEGTLWNHVDAFSEYVPDYGTTDNARPISETRVVKGGRK